MNKILKITAIISIIIITLITLTGCETKKNKNENYKIVTSFYPIYIMALNITDGAENVELTNMADVNTGCVHNYTLQTTDLKKLSDADVLIQNGLGIESFMDKIINSYKNLQIINTSENITNTITEHEEINGHVWTSINNNINQVRKIQEDLKKLNPQNSEIYDKNANEYVKELNNLNKKYKEELSELKRKKNCIFK